MHKNNPKIHPQNDPQNYPKMDPKMDPKSDPKMDPEIDAKRTPKWIQKDAGTAKTTNILRNVIFAIFLYNYLQKGFTDL